MNGAEREPNLVCRGPPIQPKSPKTKHEGSLVMGAAAAKGLGSRWAAPG